MKKTIERKPVSVIDNLDGYVSVFLAGSIEQGTAEDWQTEMVKSFNDEKIVFYNPRRDFWDATLEQNINNEVFFGQVNWELTALEMVDLIVMCIDPKTLSPITLLELGLHARSGELVVLCPEGFWRKGNVDIVCQFYTIRQVSTFDELTEYVKNYVEIKSK